MRQRPKFLDDFAGEYRMSGEQRNYRRCPTGAMHEEFKTYVDPVSGKWICFAGNCKASGRVRTGNEAASLRDRLFTRDRGVRGFSAIELPETKPINEEISAMLATRYNLPNPERYLLRLGTGELSGRVVIPYADRRGDFVFWNARTMGVQLPKYKAIEGHKPLYVPDYVFRKWCAANLIVLVEGTFDAMSLHDRMHLRTAALGGTSLSDTQFPELLHLVTVDGSRKRVCIMLDSAALSAAIKLKHKLSGLLPGHDVQVRQLPAGVKDPAAARVDQLEGLLR